jgi:hypothetical protein
MSVISGTVSENRGQLVTLYLRFFRTFKNETLTQIEEYYLLEYDAV